MRTDLFNRCAAAAFFLSAFSAVVLADEPHARATLHAETKSVRPGEAVWVAVRFEMDPGWHIYWKNPGDSGMATRIQWKLPPGFSAGPIQWPHPHKIEQPPLISYGYGEEAVFLARILAPAHFKGDRVDVAARADWLECADICIPGGADLRLTLPVTRGAPQPDLSNAEIFARARFELPLQESDWTVRAFRAADKVRLLVRPPADRPEDLPGMEFFPEDHDVVPGLAERVFYRSEGWAVLDYPVGEAAADASSLKGVLVSESGWRGEGSEKGLEVDARLEPMEAAPAVEEPASAEGVSLPFAVLLAFLGGLLLNLMPCVLPVLSIKILSFVQQAQGDRREARRQGWIFAAGVIASFWALAGTLLALQKGGERLGWGFQLQSPAFVVFLGMLFFVLGLNMLGVFEVGASLVGLGKFSGRPGAAGSFTSGVLATAVATPCTAPFMGTALGFALTQPPAASLAVFTSLGAGMAAPYVVLSSSPALLKFVPKPGGWMETFKQAMGFLLLATTVWLLWVLGLQTGVDALTSVMAALLLSGVGCWILGRWGVPSRPAATRRTASAAAVLLILGSLGWALKSAGKPAPAGGPAVPAGEGIRWEVFSPERIKEALKEGRPVFVDFTAAWCLTCQVNERTALRNEAVVRKFEDLNVVPLKADWTNRDESITRALQSHGRSGVPLYVLHAPGRKARLLPAILTPEIVLRALDEGAIISK